MKSPRNSARNNDVCWIYFIECLGGGIYIGVARDVERRFARHKIGKGSTYTRLNPPIRLLAKTVYPNRREAMAMERRLKRLPSWEKRRMALTLAGELVVEKLRNLAARVG